jgi:hypothetical protein
MTNPNHIRNTLPFTNTNEIRKEVFLLIQNLYVIEKYNFNKSVRSRNRETNKITALKTMHYW